jgi:hypothetical protein
LAGAFGAAEDLADVGRAAHGLMLGELGVEDNCVFAQEQGSGDFARIVASEGGEIAEVR